MKCSFKVEKCCFCLPLRRALLIFGYLDLIFSIAGCVLLCILIDQLLPYDMDYFFAGWAFQTLLNVFIVLTIYILDVVFDVLLLYGAHARNWRYLRIYYLYGIWSTTMKLVLNQLIMSNAIHSIAFDIIVALTKLVFQIYLLTVVRNGYKKMQSGLTMKYSRTEDED